MKKDYSTPRLIVHGSVERITLAKNNRGGGRNNDGHNDSGARNACSRGHSESAFCS